MRRIVQFPHPGPEHGADVEGSTQASWRRAIDGHGRRFMRCEAEFHDAPSAARRTGEVTFWGEWEAGAEVSELEQTGVRYGPRWVQRPLLGSPSSTLPQNTDPLVFGDRFRYAFCRQPRSPGLRNLERGSVLLFGSVLGGAFVLDTVFVVAGTTEHGADDPVPDTLHGKVTLEPMYAWLDAHPSSTRFRLYTGATPDDPVDGMFSFVPARPVDSQPVGFARPPLDLPEIVNPANARAVRFNHHVPASDIPTWWSRVVEAVLQNELVLATRLTVSPDATAPVRNAAGS